MAPRVFAAVLATVLLCALVPGSASAKWYGSTMRGKPNADYGCETALVQGALGGIVRSPTNQRSCTYNHSGYLFRQRPTFLVPATGRIRRIRIKSGPNPPRARLTVLTSPPRGHHHGPGHPRHLHLLHTPATWASRSG